MTPPSSAPLVCPLYLPGGNRMPDPTHADRMEGDGAVHGPPKGTVRMTLPFVYMRS